MLIIKQHGNMGELQYLFRSDRVRAIAGGGFSDFSGDGRFDLSMPMPPDPPLFISTTKYDNDDRHTVHTFTLHTNWPQQVSWTLGMSHNRQTIGIFNDLKQDQVNPKIGVTWNPLASTTIRCLPHLERTIPVGQTLEPTQVAGFNQFFVDGTGSDSWHYGIGLDQKITDTIFAGADISKRDIKVPLSISVVNGNNEVKKADWEERTARTYLYWAPHKWFALSAEYLYERFETPEEATGELYCTHIKTHKVPLGVQFFHPIGIFAGIKAITA